MSRLFNKYFLFFSFLISPLIVISCEEVKNSYKPPVLAATAIIEVYDPHDQFQGIVLIERGKAPFGKAIPGGKVEYGETVECAVRREMIEEVNLYLHNLKQFHVYSDPKRDFRHHTVEVTHIAEAFDMPLAGDDAALVFVVKLEDIPWDELAFDHAQVLRDYVEYKKGNGSLIMIKP